MLEKDEEWRKNTMEFSLINSPLVWLTENVAHIQANSSIYNGKIHNFRHSCRLRNGICKFNFKNCLVEKFQQTYFYLGQKNLIEFFFIHLHFNWDVDHMCDTHFFLPSLTCFIIRERRRNFALELVRTQEFESTRWNKHLKSIFSGKVCCVT